MEAIEKPLQVSMEEVHNDAVEMEQEIKENSTNDVDCSNSNGVEDTINTEDNLSVATDTAVQEVDSEILVNESVSLQDSSVDSHDQSMISTNTDSDQNEVSLNVVLIESNLTLIVPESDMKIEDISETNNENNEVVLEDSEFLCEENIIEITEKSSNETVTFKTEILVEKGISDDQEMNSNDVSDNTNNILSELGQSIELSEALCSADTGDNNNSPSKQQTLNKEELLDILEGNDVDTDVKDDNNSNSVINDDNIDQKSLETQLALKQLSRLRSTRGRFTRPVEKSSRKSRDIHKTINKLIIPTESCLSDEDNLKKLNKSSDKLTEVIINFENDTSNADKRQKKIKKSEQVLSSDHLAGMSVDNDSNKKVVDDLVEVPDRRLKKNKRNVEEVLDSSIDMSVDINSKKNIVNDLVQDWEDDDAEQEHVTEESSTKNAEENVNEAITLHQNKSSIRTSIDSASIVDNGNKYKDETQSHRRHSRVIKKKVIYDPDNPDTFTKAKIAAKYKETIEKDIIALKKPKLDSSPQTIVSKTPINKLSWKKPTPKNSKQHKRPTEIDKLLMDEGAVNMIYQLTPEAPKGRKNVKTKAEFIKKIQSSTPDGKEMKFRERKKEISKNEDEPKKISIGKRASLSSSVKSPMPAEDFETHSADDSIIYRRHSSSSYSSSCMSPRRMSDVESNTVHVVVKEKKVASVNNENGDADVETVQNEKSDVFMVETGVLDHDVIDKNDCLSLKEKLNSKLSFVLNKRKRDNTKQEKATKVRKLSKVEEQPLKFKYVTINIDGTLAEIIIKKAATKHYVETLSELEQALEYINTKMEISTTLLYSDCGTLFSGLDIKPLLDANMEKRTNCAYNLAESVRRVLCSLEHHSKLTVSGVTGACSGVGLALAALSDLVLAGERASFAWAGEGAPQPGAAAIAAPCRRFLPTLINDLLIFERRLSASEALQYGLVSRTLWPERFLEQMRAIAADIAAQPAQKVLLKKKLLKLNTGDSVSFQTCLESERDVLVEYWTSVEGQESLRAAADCDQ